MAERRIRRTRGDELENEIKMWVIESIHFVGELGGIWNKDLQSGQEDLESERLPEHRFSYVSRSTL